MLYVFNECGTPQWAVKRLQRGGMFRIYLLSNEKFGIDVNTRESDQSVDEEALASVNDVREANLFFLEKTAIRFTSKKLQPTMIVSSNDFNCDFYFISYDISDGFRLINQIRKNAYIYQQYYDKDAKQIHMILSMNIKAPKAFVEDIFLSDDGETLMMKHLMWSQKTKTLVMIGRESQVSKVKNLKRGDRGFIDMRDNSENYRNGLPVFIPMRPTKLIIVPTEGDIDKFKELCQANYKMSLDSLIFLHMENMDVLRKKLKKFSTDGYGAVTYFHPNMNTDEFYATKSSIKQQYLNEFCAKFFTYALMMMNDGRVVRIK